MQYAPPDTNGAVGPNHFVQTVNVSFAVFSKTGSVLYGPVAINTLFTGFGGLCEADNDGDPGVVYDQLADRWVITQFAVTGANGTSVPYLECLAISTSGDPTGTYYRYSCPLSRFPDYPKLGVWPDAYYMSTNDFNGNTFAGATTWAFDRTRMLAGLPATAQTFHLSTAYGGLLPSSLDGKTQPPAGSPNYFVSLGTSTSLNLWKFVEGRWMAPGHEPLVQLIAGGVEHRERERPGPWPTPGGRPRQCPPRQQGQDPEHPSSSCGPTRRAW